MAAGFVYFIEFILKCIFVYPFTLTWKAIQAIRERNPPAPPVIPVKSRPATPVEAQAALTHLNLAHRFFMQAWDGQDHTDTAMRALALASNALNQARTLDPAAKVTVEQEKNQVTYTIDHLASEILYSQAAILMYGNWLIQDRMPGMDSADSSEAVRKIHKNGRDAIAAALAALAYDRTNPKYHLVLAKAYQASSKRSAARKALQEAERLDPHNLDVLEFKAKIG